MDGASNWRPTQGADPNSVAAPAAGVDPSVSGDWRAQLPPRGRGRIVNRITEILKKHIPGPQWLVDDAQKIAVLIEEKVYTAATSQISQMMLSMQRESHTNAQQNPRNAQVIPNRNPPGPAPGLPSQGSTPAESSAIPNASMPVQGSLPSGL